MYVRKVLIAGVLIAVVALILPAVQILGDSHISVGGGRLSLRSGQGTAGHDTGVCDIVGTGETGESGYETSGPMIEEQSAPVYVGGPGVISENDFQCEKNNGTAQKTTMGGGRGAILVSDTMILLNVPDEINYGANLSVSGALVEVPANMSNYYGYLPVPMAKVTVRFPTNTPSPVTVEVETDQNGGFEAKFPGTAAQLPVGFAQITANFSGHWFDANAQWPYIHTAKAGCPQVRNPTSQDAHVKIIHSSSIINLKVSPSTVEVGDKVTVSGTVKDNESAQSSISNGVVELYLDGKKFPDAQGYKTTTVAGAFSYKDLTIPSDMNPGKHIFAVYFKREHQEGANANYTSSSATISFNVQRPTHIIFEDRLAEGEQVYRGEYANVSGTVLDNMGEPPKHYVSGEEFQYTVEIYWGGNKVGEADVDTTTGAFSYRYNIPRQQDLGVVTVSVKFVPPSGAYYLESTKSAKWLVMAKPYITLNMDTYARRDRDFKIAGYLYDDLNQGMGNRPVFVKWGNNVNYFNLTTDNKGYFEYIYHIPASQKIGPVYVTAIFEGERNAYDPATSPAPPDPSGVVNVIAGTTVEIPSGTGIKGESIYITGRLVDDLNNSVPLKYVGLYWRKSAQAAYEKLITYVKTDADGYFNVQYTIDTFQPVGKAELIVKFNGSGKFEENDAYLGFNHQNFPEYVSPSLFTSDEMKRMGYGNATYTIYARTILLIKTAPEVTRNTSNTLTVRVELYEYANGQKYNPVDGMSIDLSVGNMSLFPQKTQTHKIGNQKMDGVALFEVAMKSFLDEGNLTITASFNASKNGGAYYLSSSNKTYITLWAETQFVVLQAPKEIVEGEKAVWKVRLQERYTMGEEPIKKQNVQVYIYISTPSGGKEPKVEPKVTDDYGVIEFAQPFPTVEKGSTLEVRFIYNGSASHYYKPCNLTLPAIRMRTLGEANPTEGRDYMQLYIGIAIAAIVIIIVVFFVMAYIRKRMKYREVKRIIRRARDQLIVGDAYRETIFLAYQRLVTHLRRYGYLRRKSETFREFEKAIRNALPIDAEAMNEFLTLLEEARYSNHPFGPEHRTKAVDTLKRIESSLDRIIVSEEAALRAIEAAEGEYEEEVEIVTADKAAAMGALKPQGEGGGGGPGVPPVSDKAGVPPRPQPAGELKPAPEEMIKQGEKGKAKDAGPKPPSPPAKGGPKK